jgi:hypothetical protein
MRDTEVVWTVERSVTLASAIAIALCSGTNYVSTHTPSNRVAASTDSAMAGLSGTAREERIEWQHS